MPEELFILLKACRDPVKIELMEPRHRSEFLAGAYWLAIEHREYDLIRPLLNCVDTNTLRNRLQDDSDPKAIEAHWICLLGRISVGFKMKTQPLSTTTREIERCAQDYLKIPEDQCKDNWKIQYCFYHARAICMPAFLMMEDDNTSDTFRQQQPHSY